MLVDMHNHTVEGSDGLHDRREMIAAARACDLQALCVTDHDFILPAVVAETLTQESGLLVIPGMERTTDYGHLLCYGLSPLESPAAVAARCRLLEGLDAERRSARERQPQDDLAAIGWQVDRRRRDLWQAVAEGLPASHLWAGLPDRASDLIKAVHGVGGLVVWAHPFYGVQVLWDRLVQWSGRRHPDATVDLEAFLRHVESSEPDLWWVMNHVDAFEVASDRVRAGTVHRALAVGVAERLGKAMVGGSDAHAADMVGTAATDLPEPVETAADWLAAMGVALHRRRVRAVDLR